MATKISELPQETDKDKLHNGKIPIVVDGTNKSFTLITYWNNKLKALVAEECENHKSIYNFGGGSSGNSNSGSGNSGSNEGGNSGNEGGSEGGNSGSGESGGSSEVTAAQFEQLANRVTQAEENISTMRSNSLYIKLIDPDDNLVQGYKFNVSEGVSTVVSNFPASSTIVIRTSEPAEYLYHVNLVAYCSSTYNSSGSTTGYSLTLGQLQITKPSGGTTTYVGNKTSDLQVAQVDIYPSWGSTSAHYDLLNPAQSGDPQLASGDYTNGGSSYNFTFFLASNGDNFAGTNYITMRIQIGNWIQQFMITPGMTSGNTIEADITAGQ